MGKILLLVILILVVAYVIVGMIAAKRVKKRRAIAKAKNDALLAAAEQQTAWLMAGDPRGMYGDYPIPDLFLKDREPGHMSLAEAQNLIQPPAISDVLPGSVTPAPKALTLAAAAGEYTGIRFPKAGQTVSFGSSIVMAAPGEVVVTLPDQLSYLTEQPVLVGRRAKGGTVVETWGGDVIRTLQDKLREPDTLSVAEAQRMLDEAKRQFEEAKLPAVKPAKPDAPAWAARFSSLDFDTPRKPTPPRKPATRVLKKDGWHDPGRDEEVR